MNVSSIIRNNNKDTAFSGIPKTRATSVSITRDYSTNTSKKRT